jgi:plasmid stabilization system protein ParE
VRLPHNLAPQAIRDVEAAVAWFADGPGGEPLARRFARAVVAAAGRISQRPLLGHRRLELLPDPYRFYAVRGFDYLLVYNTARAGAPIARVLYMGRDPGPLLADLRDAPDADAPD